MKAALITGSSSGIGKAIAAKLLHNEIQVIGLARDHSKFTPESGEYYPITADLSDVKKLEKIIPQNLEFLSKSHSVYSFILNSLGGIVDDIIISKISIDSIEYLFLVYNASRKKVDEAIISNLITSPIIINDHSFIALQGPFSEKIICKFFPQSLELNFMQASSFIFNKENILISRTGYTGELGYEIWCHPSDAPKVWDKVMEAGKDDGLIPAGFGALDLLRIEAGLILFGNEFDGQIDPFEAGVGFTVPLKTKTDDFIGKESLIKRKENPQKKLVGLELIGKEKANHGDCVHIGRSQVGVITSGCISPTLSKNIALCRIDISHSEIGTEVEVGKIDGEQKRITAKIVGFPHYDPKKTRVRS